MQKLNSLVHVYASDLVSLKPRAMRDAIVPVKRGTAQKTGSQKTYFKTRGLNFEEVRQYHPGDDIRQIDWRATAKQGRPFTKVYIDDAVQYATVVLDVRPGMRFATRGDFKSVVAAKTAALVSWVVRAKNGVLSPVLLGTDIRQYKNIASEEGLVVFFKDIEKRVETADSDAAALADAVRVIKGKARAGSLVFIISDFHDFSDGVSKMLSALAVKNTIFLIHVYDAMEEKLPAAMLFFSDGKKETAIDMRVQRARTAFAKQFQETQSAIIAAAQKYRMVYVPIKTSDAYLDIVLKSLDKEGAHGV